MSEILVVKLGGTTIADQKQVLDEVAADPAVDDALRVVSAAGDRVPGLWAAGSTGQGGLQLLNHGLLVERVGAFDGHALTVALAAGKLNGYGIEPRHLRVLREVGLVEVRPQAQRRIYALRADGLVAIDDWIERYRRYWTGHLDALERHLENNQGGIDE